MKDSLDGLLSHFFVVGPAVALFVQMAFFVDPTSLADPFGLPGPRLVVLDISFVDVVIGLIRVALLGRHPEFRGRAFQDTSSFLAANFVGTYSFVITIVKLPSWFADPSPVVASSSARPFEQA